jgi:steroid Delta-isomerase
MTLHCPEPLTPLARFFNGISMEKLDSLGDIYSPAVEFRDPLHQTRGLAALRGVFEHMFKQLKNVTVTVTDAHGDERTAFLLWTMSYDLRGRERVITGTSHVKFAADGRVASQNDHWDASFPVYGEFPLIGWSMRGIKRMVSMKTGGAS